MKTKPVDRYAAIKAEKKRLAEERKKRLQAQGYGFCHHIPARAIPSSILEMQGMVHSDGTPIDGVDPKGVNRLRRELRAGRV